MLKLVRNWLSRFRLMFGGTEACVFLDCEDSFRGEVRSQLGYTRFRKVWVK